MGNGIKTRIRAFVIPLKYFQIGDFQSPITGRVCAYSSFEPICRPQSPPFLIEFFSLTREVIYPFYLRERSWIPIERKLN